MADDKGPPEMGTENRFAKVTFAVKEFGPDETNHAQPYLAIEFYDPLIPEVDGPHGHLSLQFRNQRIDIREAERAARQLKEWFHGVHLLSFEPGDQAAQRQWVKATEEKLWGRVKREREGEQPEE